MRKERSGLRANALFGLRIGLLLASVFSGWVTIVRFALGPHAFEHFGLTWVQIVGLYYCALSLGGLAYGATEPLRTYAWGAMLQGVLLVLPMYAAISVAMGLSLDRTPSIRGDLILGVIIGLAAGSILGLWMWTEERERNTDNSSGR